MNHGAFTRFDAVTVPERAVMAADVLGLCTDPEASVVVTYRDWQSNTFSPGTGANVPSYTDRLDLSFLRQTVSTREVAVSEGRYQEGDVRFIAPQATLPVTPAKPDRIVEGAVTYEVIDWRADPLSLMWIVIARRVA